MEGVVGFFAGFGLAAACGLRVFLPLLIMSVAANSGYLELTSGYGWIVSEVAVTTLALATVIEIGAYYVPWLDNLLDTVALPASFIAGTLAMSPAVAEWHPFLAWTIAIVAGGGVATVVQGGTMIVRGGSSLATGGLANPIVSTIEAGAGGILSVMAILVPILAVAVAVVALGFALKFILKSLRRSRA